NRAPDPSPPDLHRRLAPEAAEPQISVCAPSRPVVGSLASALPPHVIACSRLPTQRSSVVCESQLFADHLSGPTRQPRSTSASVSRLPGWELGGGRYGARG